MKYILTKTTIKNIQLHLETLDTFSAPNSPLGVINQLEKIPENP